MPAIDTALSDSEARMSPANPPTAATMKPGDLLHDLDRRQDDVLTQLDELQAKLDGVLAELGITAMGDGDLDAAE